MKLPLSCLKEFIELEVFNTNEIASRLSLAGIEVTGVEEQDAISEDVVTAKNHRA